MNKNSETNSNSDEREKQTRIKSPWFLYFMCMNAAMGIFFFGFNQGVFNVCQLVILQLKGYVLDDDDTETERNTYKALMTGANPLGGLIGALMGTYVLKWCGSLKKSFYATDLLGIIGTVVIICNLDFWNIILGRFLQGLAMGFSTSLVPLYIKEFSPIEISGKTGSFPQLGQKGGLLIAYLTGLALPSKHDLKEGNATDYDNDAAWRIILGAPMIFCLIRIIGLLFFFKFDAPTEQLKEHHEEQLMQFLQIVYKEQHLKDAFSQALQRYRDLGYLQKEETHEQGEKITQKLKQDENGSQQSNQQLKQNYQPITAGNVEIGIKEPHALVFDQDGNELENDLTESQLEKEEAEFEELEAETKCRRNMIGMAISLAVSLSGIDAIFYYSNKIFEDAGEEELAIYFTIGIGAISILFSFIGMAMADTAGRRPLLLGGSLIMTLSIGLLVIGDVADQVSLILVAVVIFMFGYNSTLGPVKWPAWVELMDSTWSSAAASSIFVWAFIIGVGFPYLEAAINLYGAFLLFFGFSVVCFLYMLFELKETKGKNQRQIYRLYSRKVKQPRRQAPKFSTNEHILELQGMSAFGLRAVGDKKRLDMASIHKSFHQSMKSLHGQSMHGQSIHQAKK